MSGSHGTFLDRLLQRRTLSRWDRAARLAPSLELDELQRMRVDARLLRRDIDRVLFESEGRLSMPLSGSDGIDRPLGCDWAWRPEMWRGPVSPGGLVRPGKQAEIGHELTLFHDGSVSELVLRQIRNVSGEGAAPFGLRMEAFDFDGSFLSLVLDLPKTALDGLRHNHLVRLILDTEVERKMDLFCRFNIKHGPNVEQLVREVPLGTGRCVIDFDLALAKMNEKRLVKAWVDLIFKNVRMNCLTLRDVTVVRHPRADI